MRSAYRGGLPAPGSRAGVVWSAEFLTAPVSTTTNAAALRALLADRGLTLTRASTATVQTSAAAMVTSGIGVDDPRIGDGGYGRGLVFEESRQGVLLRSEDFTNASWSRAPVALGISGDTTTAPDGTTTADTVTDTADGGATQHYVSQPASGPPANGTVMTLSVLAKAGTKSVVGLAPNNAGVGFTFDLSSGVVGAQINSAPIEKGVWSLGGGWYRCWLVFTFASASPISRLYMANTTASVLYTGAGTGTVIVWGAQLEAGRWPSELVPTAGATASRLAERLTCSATPAIVRGGRIGLAAKLALKASIGGTVDYSADPYLWSYDANNYASINRTTGAVTVVIAGSSYTTASGFTAARGDVVDYWVEAGGGALNTVVKARKNGGAVTTLGTSPAAQGTHPSAAALDLLSNAGTSNHLSAWLQSAQAYAPGRRPSWAS